MPKPNAKSTLKEIRAYVREKKLNKPEIKLTMNKTELVAGLKKHGHWESAREMGKRTASERKAKPKATPKPKKKLETVEEAYKRHLKEFSDRKKYPDAKLKGFLENIKNRDEGDYRVNVGMKNSDKGAVKAINEILKKSKPKEKATPKPKAKSFKMSARDMRDLKFRWEMWWKTFGALGLSDYINMPTRIANSAFTSQELIDNKEKRLKIFRILQDLIGDGNTYDGTTWKTITNKEVKDEIKEADI